jgi:hypothetical protein
MHVLLGRLALEDHLEAPKYVTICMCYGRW